MILDSSTTTPIVELPKVQPRSTMRELEKNSSPAKKHINCSCNLCFQEIEKPRIELRKITTDITIANREKQSALHNEKLTDVHDRNFQFVLKRLCNLNNNLGNMVILIAPTALYREGFAYLLVRMGGKRGRSTPKFSSKGEKLSNAEIGKYFFERAPPLPFSTPKIKQRIERESASNPIFNKIRLALLEKDRNDAFKLIPDSNAKEKVSTMERENILRQERKKKAHQNTVCFRTKFDEKNFTLQFRKNFSKIMSMNRSHRFFQDLSCVQKGTQGPDGTLIIHEARFNYKAMRNSDEYIKASAESLILGGKMPPSSINFVTPEEEMEYMFDLMHSTDKSKYCEYVAMKIFHFIKVFFAIEIRDFVAEFLEDSFGNLYLFNTIVLDVDLPDSFSPSPLNAEPYRVQGRISSTDIRLDDSEESISLEAEDKLTSKMTEGFRFTLSRFKHDNMLDADREEYENTFLTNKEAMSQLKRAKKINMLNADKIELRLMKRSDKMKNYFKNLRQKEKLANDSQNSACFRAPSRDSIFCSLRVRGHLSLGKTFNNPPKKWEHNTNVISTSRRERRKIIQRNYFSANQTERATTSLVTDRTLTFKRTCNRFFELRKRSESSRTNAAPTSRKLSTDIDEHLQNQRRELWNWAPSCQDFNRYPGASTRSTLLRVAVKPPKLEGFLVRKVVNMAKGVRVLPGLGLRSLLYT